MSKKSKILLLGAAAILLSLLLGLLLYLLYFSDKKEQKVPATQTPASEPVAEKPKPVDESEGRSEEVKEEAEETVVEEEFVAINQEELLQFVVDYNRRAAGDLSLAIYDFSRQEQVINYQPDNLYFTGSVYKLYIALLAWRDLDAGIFQPDEIFFAAHPLYGRVSLKECLYYMVQRSDSGCSETFLMRYDRNEAQERLRYLGLPNVLVDGFYISAADAQALLMHVYENKDGVLKKESQEVFLKALRAQHYRKYVIAGFKSITLDSYNKTGDSWLPGQRIHNDLTILQLSDGRVIMLALLTKEGGQPLIMDFARQLASYLRQELSLPTVSS